MGIVAIFRLVVKTLFLFIIFFIETVLCLAQRPVPGMRIYDSSDGYPANTGYVISQDSTGFIWIGTDQGAVCFDGHQFEVVDEKDGVTDKEILKVVPASDRKVILCPLLNNWACYKDGHLLSASELDLDQVKNRIINSCETYKGEVWLGDAHGNTSLFRLNSEGLTRVDHTIGNSFAIDQVFGDTLFITLGEEEDMVKAFYHVKEKKLYPLRGIEQYPGIDDVVMDNRRERILGYNPVKQMLRLFRFQGDYLLDFLHAYRFEKKVKQLIIDHNNDLWITFLDAGLQYWGPVHKLNPASKPIYLFPETTINYVYRDREDHIWLTTEKQGLLFISKNHWANYLLNCKFGIPSSNSPNQVQALASHQKVISYSSSFNMGKISKEGYQESELYSGSPHQITAIYQLDGKLYVYGDERVFRIDYSGNQIKVEASFRLLNVLKDLCAGPAGSNLLYAATHSGVSQLHLPDSLNSMVFHGRSTAVRLVHDSILLIGTPYGLYIQYPGQAGVLTEYSALREAHISAFLTFKDRFTIIGTTTKGLFLYDHTTLGFRPLCVEGLGNWPFIKKIVQDGDHRFWLGTDDGVYRLEKVDSLAQWHYEKYDYRDGLPSDNVLDLAISEDTLFAVTSAGLGILPVRYRKFNDQHTRVYVHKIATAHETVYAPDRMDLAYNQNNLQLSLKSFAYHKTEPVKYLYKLEGYHQRWYSTLMPELNLNDLPPGNYTLKLTVAGTPTDPYTLLPLHIHPALWQQNWFRLLVLSLLIILGILIIRSLMTRAKVRALRKMENRKRLAQLELEAIKAQINPHFIYNCLNSIQYFTQLGQPEKADKYIKTFAALLRQTMQISQETFITIGKEIVYLDNYLQMEKMRFKDKLSYHIQVPRDLRDEKIPAMMLQPFIENAIKHGIVPLEGKGELRITFGRKGKDAIEIRIEDNGPGWNPGASPDSQLGLRLASSRADTYNQLFEMGIHVDILDKSTSGGEGTGTIIELLIPIQHESFSYNY